MLPAPLKKWLESKDWYINWRYAPAVLHAWMLVRPGVRKQLRKQKQMYLSIIENLPSSSTLIFDIGANEGFISWIFIEAGYNIVAVEPVKRNVAIMRRRFRGNPRVTIVEAAADEKAGQTSFYESHHDHALGTASEKNKNSHSMSAKVTVNALTLDELINNFGLPVFIKIDVEGLEERVLKGLTARVPFLSFEAMLPAFANETEHCITWLLQLDPAYRFNFAVDNALQWDKFRSAEELMEVVNEPRSRTIEIFCKGNG